MSFLVVRRQFRQFNDVRHKTAVRRPRRRRLVCTAAWGLVYTLAWAPACTLAWGLAWAHRCILVLGHFCTPP